MSVLPIQNVSFTKSKMSVLQNPKCQFYKIQNVSKDTDEKGRERKRWHERLHSFSLLRLIGSM